MAVTKDYAKIGEMWYRVSLGDNINDFYDEIGFRLFENLEEAQDWGRQGLLAGNGIDVMIERFTYVEAEPFDDDEFGVVYDADVEYDDDWRMLLFDAHGEWIEEE